MNLFHPFVVYARIFGTSIIVQPHLEILVKPFQVVTWQNADWWNGNNNGINLN